MSEDADMEEKPRRLEEETVNYLKQIEEQWDQLGSNSSSIEDDNDIEDTKTILIENVFTELQSRMASALSERNTNFLMEKLCFASNFSNILNVLDKCCKYSIFLVRNRYSSHVLQVCLI